MARNARPRGKPSTLPDGCSRNIYLTEEIDDWLQEKADRNYISVSAQARIELDARMKAERAREAAHA